MDLLFHLQRTVAARRRIDNQRSSRQRWGMGFPLVFSAVRQLERLKSGSLSIVVVAGPLRRR
jgi:hypothetical protein